MSSSVAGHRSQNGCDVLVAKGVLAREGMWRGEEATLLTE